jgi:hypothetical protein
VKRDLRLARPRGALDVDPSPGFQEKDATVLTLVPVVGKFHSEGLTIVLRREHELVKRGHEAAGIVRSGIPASKRNRFLPFLNFRSSVWVRYLFRQHWTAISLLRKSFVSSAVSGGAYGS